MTAHDAVHEVLAQWRLERPDLDVSPIAIFGRLRRTSSIAVRELERFLGQYGLSSGTFDVLANLRRGGPPYQKTPSELAASTLLTTGAITGRLDVLAAQGLIERVASPADRRIMYARLTDEGVVLIDEVFGTHLERERRVLMRLSPRERSDLAAGLAALEAAFVEAGFLEEGARESGSDPVPPARRGRSRTR